MIIVASWNVGKVPNSILRDQEMMQGIKRLFPNWLLDRMASLRYTPNPNWSVLSVEKVFAEIHQKNIWGNNDTSSGQGSSTGQTKGAVSGLREFIHEQGIRSMVDLPCGEFGWINNVGLDGIQYLGGDIVPDIIAHNRQFEKPDRQFRLINLLEDNIPDADAILVRDCLVHFSHENIRKAMKNIKRSNTKWLITTTFTDVTLNYDIVTGDWRPLNLCLPPFNFPVPDRIIHETVEPGYETDFRGKSLGIWSVRDLADQ